jgi:hypothetical protein
MGRIHARHVERADFPLVRTLLRLTATGEAGVVDDDLLDDFLVLVAQHAEAAEAALVGRDGVVLQPGAVGELIEVRAWRARGVEVRTIEHPGTG